MRLTQITPFVCCCDLDRTVDFYSDVIGFALGFRADNYAFMRRDDVALRLIEVDPDTDIAAQQNSFYIDVDGLDAVFRAMQPALDRLPSGRVRAPFDQEYGQREFHVLDPDGTLIFFGEALTK